MALGPRLDLRQTQSLVMTPQLQQAIKLLALSNLEIESFVSEALDSNPLLEVGELRHEKGDDQPEAPAAEHERGQISVHVGYRGRTPSSRIGTRALVVYSWFKWTRAALELSLLCDTSFSSDV